MPVVEFLCGLVFFTAACHYKAKIIMKFNNVHRLQAYKIDIGQYLTVTLSYSLYSHPTCRYLPIPD